MRLVYRQGNYGSICFPYKNSCEFATKTCLKQCSEQYNDMTWFDETFKYFKSVSGVKLYAQIKAELEDGNFKLLTWFDSGDCPTSLTNKVSDIINQLHEDDFSQLGFTRNEKLWLKVKDLEEDDQCYSNVTTKTRFMLTVERGTKIIKEGRYAVPDYKKQRVCIIHHHTFDKPVEESIDKIISNGGGLVRYCGGGGSYIEMKTVTEPKVVVQCFPNNSNAPIIGEMYEANCGYCLGDGTGCFTEK